MIELKFYRDDEYVYINNPDGTTKRVPIEDFESAISGEGGSGSGGLTPLIVNCTITQDHGFTVYTLDKTWKEINDAYLTGTVIVRRADANKTENYIVLGCKYYDNSGDKTFEVDFGSGYDALSLSTTTENGYPTYTST